MCNGECFIDLYDGIVIWHCGQMTEREPLLWGKTHADLITEVKARFGCSTNFRINDHRTPVTKLNPTFDLVYDIKTAEELAREYWDAKRKVQGLEELCRACGIPVPTNPYPPEEEAADV